MQVQDIISRAMVMNGVLASGSSPTTQEQTDGLNAYNMMIAAFYGDIIGPKLQLKTILAGSQAGWPGFNYAASGVAATISLPTSPQDGMRIGLVDPSNTLSGAPVTINPGSYGMTIDTSGSVYYGAQTFSTPGTQLSWFFRADTGTWIGEVDQTLTQLPLLPERMAEGLTAMLSVRLADSFGGSAQLTDNVKEMAAKARMDIAWRYGYSLGPDAFGGQVRNPASFWAGNDFATAPVSQSAASVVGHAFALGKMTSPANYVSGPDMLAALPYLQWMLKSWEADGCNLWRDTDVVITWNAGVTAQEVTGVLDIFDARWTGAIGDGNTLERKLSRWERAEYNELPNKTVQGMPTCYTVVKGANGTNDGVEVRVWPVPVAAGRMLCDSARMFADITSPAQTIDLPQEWTETVYVCLADRLATIWPTPIDVKLKLQQGAQALRQRLLDFDRPASVQLEPEMGFRGRYWRSGARAVV